MKAIVTGNNGFIGTHLTAFLNSKAIEVYPIAHQKFKNSYKLKSEISEINPDYIFHLSAYGNHAHQKDMKKMFETNIINTFKLLMISNQINYKAFINIGSSSEYGRKLNPMKETDNPETDTFYGASKVCTTYLCRAFAKQYQKAIVTIRPFSVYGEGEADFRFIPKVIQHLNVGEIMTVDPNPNHDWIYVHDFISGVYKILKNIRKLQGGTVNIGTGKQFTNLEVIRILEKISGKKLKMRKKSGLRNYDNNMWLADNQKLRSLGWKQEFSLRDGLVKTYDYYTK